MTVAHDEKIGTMLSKIDELGMADNTIVIYSTDNGPDYNSWSDAAITPFRSEKNTRRELDGPCWPQRKDPVFASKTVSSTPAGADQTSASAALSAGLATMCRDIASRISTLNQHRTPGNSEASTASAS